MTTLLCLIVGYSRETRVFKWTFLWDSSFSLPSSCLMSLWLRRALLAHIKQRLMILKWILRCKKKKWSGCLWGVDCSQFFCWSLLSVLFDDSRWVSAGLPQTLFSCILFINILINCLIPLWPTFKWDHREIAANCTHW